MRGGGSYGEYFAPKKIPTTPPIMPKIIEVNDNTPTPHSAGMYPPTVEPTTAPTMIKGFDPMVRSAGFEPAALSSAS